MSGGIATFFTSSIAYGANNVLENAMYFYNGDDKAVGPVRLAEQEIAYWVYGDREVGDYFYYTTDVALSGYGFLGSFKNFNPDKYQLMYKSSKIESYNPNHSYKLFRELPEDYLKGYKTATGIDYFSNGLGGIFDVMSIFSDNSNENMAEK